MGAGNGTALAAPQIGTPEISRVHDPSTVGRWRRSFGSVQPATLHGIIRNLEQGQQLEDWVDLANWMRYTDATVRAAWGTRVSPVAGADFEVLPGQHSPEDKQLAEEAADGWREDLEYCTDLERVFADLLDAAAIGWSGAENMWRSSGRTWSNRPVWIDARDLKTATTGAWSVRLPTGLWEPLQRHPGKFILHTPRNISTIPTLSGDLLSVAWPWLFKRWGEKFWVAALEKWAAPYIYGRATTGTTPALRTALREMIDAISSGASSVIEVPDGAPDPLVALDVSDSVKEAYSPAISYFNQEIIKGLLGSTDNVEATHGSNARAESQGETTILPRNMSDAKRLAGTLERDWAAWWCRYNASYFGRVPPTPRLVFTLVKEAELRAPIYHYHLQGHIVSRNDVRAQLGLDPLPADRGGDELLDIRDVPAAGGADAASPFSAKRPSRLTATLPRKPRQMALPLTSRATTSPTTPASQPNPIASALRSASGGREK